MKKQILARSMTGNQYVYEAILDREEFTRSAVREILDSLLDSFGDPVYAQFLDQIQASDPDQLRQLAQMIDAAEARQRGQH